MLGVGVVVEQGLMGEEQAHEGVLHREQRQLARSVDAALELTGKMEDGKKQLFEWIEERVCVPRR